MYDKGISLYVAFLLILFAVSGCTKANRAAISGHVTLDGQAVDDGVISFVSVDARPSLSAWGTIARGDYSIPAKQGPAIGNNRVEIHWSRKTGNRARHDPKMDEYREAIPDQFNRNSQLRVDVKPGENRLDFPLKTK
jgi:hypothetical protein